MIYVWEPTNEDCRQMLPAIEALKVKFEDDLAIEKVDIYKSQSLITKLCRKIPSSLPAVVTVEHGKVKEVVCQQLTPERLHQLALDLIAG
jgi:thioredoxin reductase (NADPH)